MRYNSVAAGFCYPTVRWAFKSGNIASYGTNGASCGDGGNNSSTIYPNGTCRMVRIPSGQANIPSVC